MNAPDPAERSRFLRWLENYWYHYKWHTIIALFFVFTFVVILVQCSSRETYDLTVTYAGPRILNTVEQDGFGSALEAVLPADYDGNGNKAVQLVTYGVYSEEELFLAYSSEGPDGTRVTDDFDYSNARKQNVDESTAFSTFVKTGESAILFVSPYVYEAYGLSTLAVPLAETFGSEIPEGAADDYAVRLKDTGFYAAYATVRELPDDTLILLMRRIVYGKTAKKAVYGQYEQTYRALLSYRPE